MLLMFTEQKSKFSGGRGGSGGGGQGVQGGTCFPKCMDAGTSVRQDGNLQYWATKLCLAYPFLKFNPNSCSEGAVIKAVADTGL